MVEQLIICNKVKFSEYLSCRELVLQPQSFGNKAVPKERPMPSCRGCIWVRRAALPISLTCVNPSTCYHAAEGGKVRQKPVGFQCCYSAGCVCLNRVKVKLTCRAAICAPICSALTSGATCTQTGSGWTQIST